MSEKGKTFVDLCLAGEVGVEDIDDFVDEWHRRSEVLGRTGRSRVRQQPLHEFLGLTRDEYGLWVEQASALRFILAARKRHQSLDKVLQDAERFGVAARARDKVEAKRLMEWLAKTGRLGAKG